MFALSRLAAVLFAASLAGCALQASTDQLASGNPAATPYAAGATTSYCVGGKLNEAAGGLTCNWAKTVKEACDAIRVSTLARDSITRGPEKGLMCSNGERLVYVNTR